MTPVMVVSVVAVIAFALAFDLYCLRDLLQAERVLYFCPRVWAAIICFSTPLGGMAYLTFGRPR
jgi:hypothetical protein